MVVLVPCHSYTLLSLIALLPSILFVTKYMITDITLNKLLHQLRKGKDIILSLFIPFVTCFLSLYKYKFLTYFIFLLSEELLQGLPVMFNFCVRKILEKLQSLLL
jgi:hypothetical protein